MSAYNGGAAFPRPASKGNDYLSGDTEVVIDPQEGMTLREWFAGQHLATLGNWCADDPGQRARACYKQADAMIAFGRKGIPA